MGWFSRRTDSDKVLINNLPDHIGILEEANGECQKGNYKKASSLIKLLLSYIKEEGQVPGLSKGVPERLNNKIYKPLLLLSLALDKSNYFDLKLYNPILKNLKRLRRA